MEKIDKLIMKYLILIGLVILVIVNGNHIMNFLKNFYGIISPVIMGFAIAYVVNLLMVIYEKKWFTNTTNKYLIGTRRPVSMILAFLTIFLVISFVIWMVIPQLVDAVTQFASSIPKIADDVTAWIETNQASNPQISKTIESFDIDLNNIIQSVVTFFNNLSKRLLSGLLTFIASTATNIINLVLSLMLSAYVLLSKNRLKIQSKTILSTYLSEGHYSRFMHIMRVMNESFSSFFAGEVIEAFILGILVTSGMFIFRLPYAAMIGALTGMMALIPILGAYLSAFVGFFMILTNSPRQAVFYLIFITVIQQLEGNFIYPKIVGQSIGLPGLWVLVSVTIGGGLFGIPGMLLGVPIAASVYKLLKEDVGKRKNLPQDPNT